IPAENIFILTNSRYSEIVLQQLPMVNAAQILLEPAMRNTAPCILYASLKIKKSNPNALVVVAPSDHWIEDEQSFIKNLQQSFDFCKANDALMTIGIKPTFPNTGYGYIEVGEVASDGIRKIKQFREKPDYETAKLFFES